MISKTDSIPCVYSTEHIRVKGYLGRRPRQPWPKWVSIASSRPCVTSGRLLRNTLLRMIWFFRSPAGYSRKPTKPSSRGKCCLAEGDLRRWTRSVPTSGASVCECVRSCRYTVSSECHLMKTGFRLN